MPGRSRDLSLLPTHSDWLWEPPSLPFNGYYVLCPHVVEDLLHVG